MAPSEGAAPDTPPATRAKRRPHRRGEILAAALQLFEERGYHATGIDDIGAVAGMSGPAIYRHFRNKDELLETLLLESTSAFRERAAAISAATTDPPAALAALVDDYVDALIEKPGLAVVAAYERRNLRPEVAAAIARAERDTVDEWLKPLSVLRPEPAIELRTMVNGVMAMAVAVSTSRVTLARATRGRIARELIVRALGLGPAAARG